MLKRKSLFGHFSADPYSFDGYITCGYEEGPFLTTIGYDRDNGLGSIAPSTQLISAASSFRFTLNRDMLVSDGLIRAYKAVVEGANFSGECFAVPDYSFDEDRRIVYSDGNYSLWEALPTRIEFMQVFGGSAGTMSLSFPMKRTVHGDNRASWGTVYSGSKESTKINPLSFTDAKEGDQIRFKIKILEEVFS